jgi:hypothetical protein
VKTPKEFREFVEPTPDERYAQAVRTAEGAPYALRPFFVPEAVYEEDDQRTFASEWAAQELVHKNISSDTFNMLRRDGKLNLLHEGLAMMAEPDLDIHGDWLRSPQREAIQAASQPILEQLEREVEEAYFFRQLSA